MVEFSDLFESDEEGFVKKAKVGITSIFKIMRVTLSWFAAHLHSLYAADN